MLVGLNKFFSAFSVFGGWRHHIYTYNGLDFICTYIIYVNIINTINHKPRQVLLT